MASRIDKLVEDLNKRHAIATYGGGMVVINEHRDPFTTRLRYTLSSFAEFAQRTKHLPLVKVGEHEYEPASEVWLKHPKARRYMGGIVFDPTERLEAPDYYNTWTGWATDPIPHPWPRFQEHLYEAICNGTQHLYDYLMLFLARMVQVPGEPAGTALVFIGPAGAGKTLASRLFSRLCGAHALHVTQPRHLTGNFNAILQDKLCLVVDEASSLGHNATAKGVLKALITEPELIIERKGHEPVSARNHLHIIVCSNEESAVAVDQDDRRFCVFEVSGKWTRNTRHFAALAKEMDEGGLGGFMFDLLAYDLNKRDFRDVPQTEMLRRQKLHSMDPYQAWWFDKLNEGHLPGQQNGEWNHEVPRDELLEDFRQFANGTRLAVTPTALGMRLKKLVPELGQFRESYGERRRYWTLPSLADCRAHFNRITRSNHWPEGGE